jgi:hypothetical protein
VQKIAVDLKNYRCFPLDAPARFTIGDGFTALVGANNSGKTTILRFFYEFRHLFANLASPPGVLPTLMTGNWQTPLQGVVDASEIFHAGDNDRGIEFRLRLTTPVTDRPQTPSELVFTVSRENNIRVEAPEMAGFNFGAAAWNDTRVYVDSTDYDFGPWFKVFQSLANSLLLPAFRNAVNQGAGTLNDLPIGSAFIEQWDA